MKVLCVAFGTLAVLAAPADASACACCDGVQTAVPLSWSADGQGVIVQYTDHTGCRLVEAVMALNRIGPTDTVKTRSAYYDLNAAKEKVTLPLETLDTAVDRAEANLKQVQHTPADTGLVATHPKPAAALPPAAFRVVKRKATAAELDADEVDTDSPWGKAYRHLTVQVRHGKAWVTAWQGLVPEVPECPPASGKCRAVPVRVTVWPSPAGAWGLVLVKSHGQQAFTTDVHPVALPQGGKPGAP